MNYRTLGRTGLTVSEIGLGGLAIGGPFTLGGLAFGRGEIDDKNSLKMIQVALDAGINFIDTADIYGYGKSEEIIGRAVTGPKREKVIISTKVGNRGDEKKWFKDFSPAWVAAACEQSLKRLNTDYIDLYLMHTPDNDFRFADETFEVFNALKKQGKIRAYGCSAGSAEQGIKFIQAGFGDAVETAYSIAERGAVNELFPMAEHADVGIVVKAPLLSGLLSGKYDKNTVFDEDDFRKTLYPRKRLLQAIDVVDMLKPVAAELDLTPAQLALKYCLVRPEVSTVIPGAKTAGQILENTRASSNHDLPVSVLDQIEREVGQTIP
jgi:aryl-alcohol dehydrogenase-like predicted oxidoreductase